MDVKLPNGQVIKNVPEGTSQADLVAKLQQNGIDTSWYKPGTQADTSSPAPAPVGITPSSGDSLGRGLVQGGSLGFGDELGGAVRAALEGFSPSDPNDKRSLIDRISQEYARGRDVERQENSAAQQANPGSYLAGQVGGALVNPLTLTGAGAVTQGAAYGLGSGEGGVADQALSTGLGAGAGLAAQAAGPVLSSAGKKLYDVATVVPARVGQLAGGALNVVDRVPGLQGVSKLVPKTRALKFLADDALPWLERRFPGKLDFSGAADDLVGALERVRSSGAAGDVAGAAAAGLEAANLGRAAAKVGNLNQYAGELLNSLGGHLALNATGVAGAPILHGISAVTGAGQVAGAAAAGTGALLKTQPAQAAISQPFTDVFKYLTGREPESAQEVGSEVYKAQADSPELREALRNRE